MTRTFLQEETIQVKLEKAEGEDGLWYKGPKKVRKISVRNDNIRCLKILDTPFRSLQCQIQKSSGILKRRCPCSDCTLCPIHPPPVPTGLEQEALVRGTSGVEAALEDCGAGCQLCFLPTQLQR
eukprot:768166-Hanusia_phi.AAC.6